jgi:hypothetical protein
VRYTRGYFQGPLAPMWERRGGASCAGCQQCKRRSSGGREYAGPPGWTAAPAVCCCAVLRGAVQCRGVLRCTVPRHAVLCCAALCCIAQLRAVLCHAVPCSSALCCAGLRCAVLCSAAACCRLRWTGPEIGETSVGLHASGCVGAKQLGMLPACLPALLVRVLACSLEAWIVSLPWPS